MKERDVPEEYKKTVQVATPDYGTEYNFYEMLFGNFEPLGVVYALYEGRINAGEIIEYNGLPCYRFFSNRRYPIWTAFTITNEVVNLIGGKGTIENPERFAAVLPEVTKESYTAALRQLNASRRVQVYGTRILYENVEKHGPGKHYSVSLNTGGMTRPTLRYNLIEGMCAAIGELTEEEIADRVKKSGSKAARVNAIADRLTNYFRRVLVAENPPKTDEDAFRFVLEDVYSLEVYEPDPEKSYILMNYNVSKILMMLAVLPKSAVTDPDGDTYRNCFNLILSDKDFREELKKNYPDVVKPHIEAFEAALEENMRVRKEHGEDVGIKDYVQLKGDGQNLPYYIRQTPEDGEGENGGEE